MQIRMDMVETGSTIMACKMLGMVPQTHEPDDFNLYVRTVGSTVIVTRSDDDSTIVKAVGFSAAMIKLANFYRLPVIVSVDPGLTVTKKATELVGTYAPTLTGEQFVRSSDGVEVRAGDTVVQTDTLGGEHVMIIESITSRGIVTRDLTGDQTRNVFHWNDFRALLSPVLATGVARIRLYREPVGTGYRKSFRKHKSTSVSRARRGGA